jgi:hypothetical protein
MVLAWVVAAGGPPNQNPPGLGESVSERGCFTPKVAGGGEFPDGGMKIWGGGSESF